MSNQLSPDLFPDPPRRSRHRRNPMNRRQRLGVWMIMVAGIFFIAGGLYSYYDPKNILNRKTEIPLISPAPGPIKERPETPGGVEVPHKDVTIFDQLGKKNASAARIEHLLPPAETPNDKAVEVGGQNPPEQPEPSASTTQIPTAPVQAPVIADVPPVAPSVASPVGTPVTPPVVSPATPPVTKVPESQPVPQSVLSQTDLEPIKPLAIVKPVMTELSKTPSKDVPPKEVLPLKDITIKLGKPGEKATVKPESKNQLKVESTPVMPAGQQRVQLAAYPSVAQAEEKMLQIVSGHAQLLRQVKLSVAKADLGARGTFYRIQSQLLSVPAAHKLCADLKAAGVGCILVK
ncbi:MAG: hypothetical protein WBK91_04385 [Alphaproteobacteria bacterium]